MTAGYTSSELKLNTSATAIPTANVTSDGAGHVAPGTGVSNLHATVSGPTAGLYATYFNAGFSSDVTVKFDFLKLNETFNDLLATTVATNPFVSFAGAGSVDLLNSTVIGNLNYRFDLYPNFWTEPTVGAPIYQFELWFGRRPAWPSQRQSRQSTRWRPFRHLDPLGNGVLMTTTLTGLAYNDVVVQGGFIPVIRISREQSAGAIRSRPYARRRHSRIELRFWGRDKLVRARRCLRGSAPVRRGRQGRRTLPVVKGDPSPSPNRCRRLFSRRMV